MFYHVHLRFTESEVVNVCLTGFRGVDSLEELRRAVVEAISAVVTARAPFQWVDGPLVTAMRQGDIILIDELNLAEDAVLERMNRHVSSSHHQNLLLHCSKRVL